MKREYVNEGGTENLEGLLSALEKCIVGENDLIIPIDLAERIAYEVHNHFHSILFKKLEPKIKDEFNSKEYTIVGADYATRYPRFCILRDESGKYYKMHFRYHHDEVVIDPFTPQYFRDCVVCKHVGVKKRQIEIIEPE